MRKYLVLFGGICIISTSFYGLYSAYAPKTGPLGNGPDEVWVWFNFLVFFITGLAFLGLAATMFWQRSKNG